MGVSVSASYAMRARSCRVSRSRMRLLNVDPARPPPCWGFGASIAGAGGGASSAKRAFFTELRRRSFFSALAFSAPMELAPMDATC